MQGYWLWWKFKKETENRKVDENKSGLTKPLHAKGNNQLLSYTIFTGQCQECLEATLLQTIYTPNQISWIQVKDKIISEWQPLPQNLTLPGCLCLCIYIQYNITRDIIWFFYIGWDMKMTSLFKINVIHQYLT